MPQITSTGRLRAIGGPERHCDRDLDGVLWVKVSVNGATQFWYSTDQGNRWYYPGSDSDVPFPLSTYFPDGWHIDNEGFGHLVVRLSNTKLRYCRARPHGKHRGWVWAYVDFEPSSEALVLQSGVDIITFKSGTGWKTFIASGTTSKDSNGIYQNALRLTRIDVASNGWATLGSTEVVRTATGASYPYGSLTFQHTGSGKNATATPHVYLVTSINTPDTSQARQDPLQLVKFAYQSGSWTQLAPVTLDAAVDTTGRTMRASYDGARVVTAYGTRDRSVGVGSSQIRTVDWLEADGTVTRHDPPALGAGYPLGTSMAIEPISDDLYLAAYGTTNENPQWIRYTRASNSWNSWQQVGPAVMGGVEGRVTLKQYVSSSAVDCVYLSGAASPFTLFYVRLATINHTPSVPRLLAPAASSVADLATNGVTFGWQFVDPDPGDIQSAWQLRRKTTAAGSAYSYFNAAAGTWGTVAVWNTGDDDSWGFGPGAWPNGVTYQWSVNTQDSAGVASGFAPDSLVTASDIPVATVTSPIASYSDDSSPVITWSYLSASPQRTWRIRVFDLATYTGAGFDPAASTAVWDSGETASSDARVTRVGVPLLNRSVYRAYIRVSDSNGLYSLWAYGEFLLILTPAPAPALEVLTERAYLSGLPRVRLRVQGTTNMLTASQSYSHVANSDDWENDANASFGAGTGGAIIGSRSLQLTAAAAGTVRVRSGPGLAPIDTTGNPVPVPRDFPAAPGQTYTALASFTAASNPRLCRPILRFYSPTDILLATAAGAPTASVVNFPTQLAVTGVAPVGCDRVRLVLEVADMAAGEVHWVDAIDLHAGLATAFSPGGLVRSQTFTVYRLLDGGVPTPVRSATAVAPDTHQYLLAYDREMPFGTQVSYTVTAASPIGGSGQFLVSDPSPPAVATVDSDVWGLRDPLEQDAEARALVTASELDRNSLQSVYRPAGRSLPLVESEGSTGDDATKLSLFVESVASRRAMRALLNRKATLLLQSPAGDATYIWIDDQKISAQGGVGQLIDLTYVEVDAP